MSGSRTPSSFEHGVEFYNETLLQKCARRLREEPLIPIGFAATCYAFYHASLSVRAGDHYRTNRMFRYRIYGQAFTLVAIVAGSYYYNADRLLRKEYEAVKAEQKAKEKNEAWIKELEFRDEEEKEQERMRNNNSKVGRGRSKRSAADDDGGGKGSDKDKKEEKKGIIGEVVVDSIKEGKVVLELKKVAQDTAEVVKENIVDPTKKSE